MPRQKDTPGEKESKEDISSPGVPTRTLVEH
jgi:hypothetical protein